MTSPWKSILARLSSRLGSPPARRTPVKNRRRPGFRVEALEDRLVPAFAVQYSTDGGATFTTVSDNGPGDGLAPANLVRVDTGAGTIRGTSVYSSSGTTFTGITLGITGFAPAVLNRLVLRATVNDVTTAPNPQVYRDSFSGSITNTAAPVLSGRSWIDGGNIQFGMSGGSILLDSGVRPFASGGGSDQITTFDATPAAGTSPYSVTIELRATFTGGVAPNDSSLSLNAAGNVYGGAALGDYVWEDLNADGLQQANEPGIPDVPVTLTGTQTVTNQPVTRTTTTGPGGAYLFDALLPGTYAVAFGTPAGYVPTAANANANGSDAADSDASPATGKTGNYTLARGEVNLTVDAGFYKLASLGDFVWEDLNADGLQQANEPGIAGVGVQLLDAAGNPIAGKTTTTDGTGYYKFDGLVPGTYAVQFTAPAGYTPTAANVNANGSDAADSDAAPATGKTGFYTLASGEYNPTVDAGYYKLAALGDFVWNDANGNGVQEATEPGIGGVLVTLTGTTGSGTPVLLTTTTAADGSYLFPNLTPGAYAVSFPAVAGYERTVANAGGDDAKDSDADATTGGTGGYTLASGETNRTVDAGYYRPVSVGDFVWHDLNANGLQDATEPGIGNVALTLTGTTGAGVSVTLTTTTAANGSYLFPGLPPGTYAVAVDAANFAAGGALAAYVASPTLQGADRAVDSNVSPAGTSPAFLPGGTTDRTLDFGYHQLAALGDFVWHDQNANGKQDGTEPGIGGVLVTLTGTTGSGATVTLATTTAADGSYLFSGLTPGTYSVTFGAVAGYERTVADAGGNDAADSDADATTGGTGNYALASGETNRTVDAGYYQLASLGDFVWHDLNADGDQDAGEPGIPGATVRLLDAGGTQVDVTTTDATGFYQFTGLTPGVGYSVAFVTPAGFAAASPRQAAGAPAATDSDGPASDRVVLASGEFNPTLDAGFYNPVTVGDFVWLDRNANGLQDAGEPGIGGVVVTLNGTTGGGVTVSQSATTDANGGYLFAGLPPGTYAVSVAAANFAAGGALAGYAATAALQGADRAADSNTSPAGTTPAALPSGAEDRTLDFGYYQPAALGDFVWDDRNANGRQDAGEPGIGGVTVTLTGTTGAGATVTQTTTTAADGSYLFPNLTPGTYAVAFPAVAGYVRTGADAGADDAKDSDAGAGGATGSYTLASGETNRTVDAGYYQLVSVGDFVWNDANGNGLQDAGEPGIAGVTLTLTGTTGAGSPVTLTTATNGAGGYLFTALPPGTYSVAVDAANFAAGGALAGYTATAALQGADRAADSNTSPAATTPTALPGGTSDLTLDFGYYKPVSVGDFVWLDRNANGLQDSGEPGIGNVALTLTGTTGSGAPVSLTTTTAADGSYLFAGLPPGTYTVAVAAANFAAGGPLAAYVASSTLTGPDRAVDSNVSPAGTTPAFLPGGSSDRTLDFGYHKLAALGDFVWNDANGNGVQDAGEPGIGGVTVTLTGTTGSGTTVTLTTTTAADGSYLFPNLTPGAYTVTFAAVAGYVRTGADAGGNDAADSDADATTGGTGSYTLASGETNRTVDAGYYKLAALGDFVWEDRNADGDQDAGEPGIAGVVVTLSGTTGSGAAVSKTATTDVNGKYLFADLIPGTYAVSFPAVAGYVRTGANAGADDAKDSDASATTGATGNYTLVSGQTDLSVDAGYYKLAALGDFVWHDQNANGKQDAGEPGIGGVVVTLTGTTGAGAAVTQTATTAADGSYLFSGLIPGTYAVSFPAIGGYVRTGADAGADDAKDSDASATTGGTGGYTLASGETNRTVDAGYYKLAALGDFVWEDVNADGDQDAGEPGISGVTVTLTGTTGAGASVTRTATTDAGGKYLFTDLIPGTYAVTFATVAGFARTGANVGADDAKDSDASAATGATGSYTLVGGQTDLTVDAGYVRQTPKIDIEKKTDGSPNGNPTAPDYDNEDAPTGAGVPILTPGTAVTWTYKVTNTGNVPFAKADVVVSDDNGTAATADDLTVANGKITLVAGQAAAADNVLQPGEVWLYQATGVVQDLSTPGAATTLDFSGSSATSGTAGNVRTFTVGGVSVNASGFARDKSTGQWTTAWLGSYGGGLGVTDGSEGDGSSNMHTVDNVGRDNYVLFEFNQNVIVDAATLGYVVNDSDLTYWIGTIPNAFTSHQTLSDGLLTSLGFTEVNLTDLTTARTADLNAGNRSGNVLVIAAWTGDCTAEDRFKIQKVKVQQPQAGVYANTGSVAAPGAPGDSDLSHYKNPTAAPTGSISGRKFLDVSGNGLNYVAGANAPADTPLAGVTVYLDLNNNKVKDAGEPSQVTNGGGEYSFSGLPADTYYVREVVPAGYVRTAPALDDFYKVVLASGASVGGKDFANAETCDAGTVTNLSFLIAHADGTTETVTDLRGKTREGDLVTATFTVNVPAGQTHPVTFASYTAPEPYFNADTASQQKIYDLATGEFGPGTGTLTVRIPNCYYQIDLVCGLVIDKLGPAGSNIFYTPQGRLESADNGGVNCLCGGSAATIAGYKFLDDDADGVWDAGEPGLKNWTIFLDTNGNGTRDAGEFATVTDANGYYRINNLPAGTYKVREVQQPGWVQSAGPKGADTLSLSAGQDRTGVNFGNYQNATVTGYKFNDKNADGLWDKDGADNCPGNADDEVGLSGWTIFVDYDADGVKDANEPSAVTNGSGAYTIAGVKPGTWFVEEVGQAGWSKMTGDTKLTLGSGDCAANVNFGNYKAGTSTTGGALVRGDTATIGFWQNKNGQALLNALNGGSSSKALGNWLAASFPNMFGASAGTANNLTNKTNAQVAAYFTTLFKKTGNKVEAQVLAAAFAVYVTDSDRAGTTAAAYGFTVSSAGTGARTYNVGSSGAAFGVSNNATRTVLQLLQAADARAVGGNLWNGNSTNRTLGAGVFAGINEKGDIV